MVYARGPQKSSNRGLKVMIVFALGLVLTLPMLYLAFQQSSLVDYGYRVTELRRQNAELRETQSRLRAELAYLTRPDRIYEQMRKQNLKPVPLDAQYIVEFAGSDVPQNLVASN